MSKGRNSKPVEISIVDNLFFYARAKLTSAKYREKRDSTPKGKALKALNKALREAINAGDFKRAAEIAKELKKVKAMNDEEYEQYRKSAATASRYARQALNKAVNAAIAIKGQEPTPFESVEELKNSKPWG